MGLDVGGTSTRVLMADLSGRRRGTGRAGGGNPVARGEPTARHNVATAVRQAMGTESPERISAVVMGVAGVSTLGDDSPVFDPVWQELGLRCPVRLVADAVAAFAAATHHPHGTVLIAGTGAIACAIDAGTVTTRSDGYGWLLGDLGSGWWLGKQAAYAALQHAAGHGPGGVLVSTVLDRLLGTDRAEVPDVNRVITAAVARPPVTLSELAPLVTAAADRDDPVATGIIDEAVEHLTRSVAWARGASETGPIALAGSLAAEDTAVSRPLTARLHDRYPDVPIRRGSDGAAGAAWLAATTVTDPERHTELHARLMGTAP